MTSTDNEIYSYNQISQIKINLISDLHIEFSTFDITMLNGDADIIVLAGDIGSGMDALPLIKSMTELKPVIMVLGNHELYGHDVNIYQRWAEVKINNFYFLNNSSIDLLGCRFIGSTLWTDLANGKEFSLAKRTISDYIKIKNWTPLESMKQHAISVKYITNALQQAADDQIPVIVITHHPPTYRAIHPIYKNIPGNGSFASDLDYLIYYHTPVAWLFGHTHSSLDFNMDATRLISNPRGYPRRNSDGGDIEYENMEFDSQLLVIIDLVQTISKLNN